MKICAASMAQQTRAWARGGAPAPCVPVVRATTTGKPAERDGNSPFRTHPVSELGVLTKACNPCTAISNRSVTIHRPRTVSC